jgi:hypothetical protein
MSRSLKTLTLREMAVMPQRKAWLGRHIAGGAAAIDPWLPKIRLGLSAFVRTMIESTPQPQASLAARVRLRASLAMALTLVPGAAAHAEPSVMAQGLLGMPANDSAAALKFATPDGGTEFVLDRSQRQMAFVQFSGQDEVLALKPVAGPRGDELYKTDTGEVVIRITSIGGVTVFRDAARMGMPASPVGPAAMLKPLPVQAGSVETRLAQLERDSVRGLGRRVPFTGPTGTGGQAGAVVQDAAVRALEGMATARSTQVQRVVLVVGQKPTAMLSQDGALIVVVAPNMGYAGRPSAAAVAQALGPADTATFASRAVTSVQVAAPVANPARRAGNR